LWSAHRPAIAFPIWNAVVPWTRLDSLGHIHEVAAGDFYHQEMESVPEQTWSSAGFITATASGLLGLHVDSISKELTFAPHMPPEWQSLSVNNVSVGNSTLGLDLTEKSQQVDLAVTNQGTPVKMTFDPEIALGAKVLSARCGDRPLKAVPEMHAEDEHARIEFTADSGSTRCSIAYQGGVTLVLPRTAPVIGEASHGIKITGVNLQDQVLAVEADVNSAGPQFMEVRTPWKALSAEGAKISPEGDGLYRVDFNATGQTGYSHRTFTIHFDRQ
jgi:hypothetical protein